MWRHLRSHSRNGKHTIASYHLLLLFRLVHHRLLLRCGTGARTATNEILHLLIICDLNSIDIKLLLGTFGRQLFILYRMLSLVELGIVPTVIYLICLLILTTSVLFLKVLGNKLLWLDTLRKILPEIIYLLSRLISVIMRVGILRIYKLGVLRILLLLGYYLIRKLLLFWIIKSISMLALLYHVLFHCRLLEAS